MGLHQFTNGIENHKSEMTQVIESKGFYSMHDDSYSYTVGLHNLGLRELIVFDQSPNVTEELFGLLFHFARNGIIHLTPGADLSCVLTPVPSLRDCLDELKESHFYAARNYLGTWAFDVVEVHIEAMAKKADTK